MLKTVSRALLSESFHCRVVCHRTASTCSSTRTLNSQNFLITVTARLSVTTIAELYTFCVRRVVTELGCGQFILPADSIHTLAV